MVSEKLTIYQYPKCSTCKNAIAWLEKHKVPHTAYDVKTTPPPKALLRQLLKDSQLPLKRFFNTSGDLYRELGLKDKLDHMNDDAALELLSKNGMLVKRPLAYRGKHITLGFKETVYHDTWL